MTFTGSWRSKISSSAVARSPSVDAGDFWMKMSPWLPCSKACSTRSTESSSDIIKRVIFGSVTVSGTLRLSWLTKSGITEPREPITLP